MVDPSVLHAVGYDPNEVCGFAFGLGVERIAARRFGVADIETSIETTFDFSSSFMIGGRHDCVLRLAFRLCWACRSRCVGRATLSGLNHESAKQLIVIRL